MHGGKGNLWRRLMTNNSDQNSTEQSGFVFKSKLVNPQVEDEALIQKYHEKIIEAATELFGRDGYHSTTIRQIVKQSGVGIGSIYQYVKNKEEILVLILEHILNRYEYELSSAVNANESHLKRLRIGIETYYHIVDQEHHKIKLAYSSSASLSQPYRDYIKELELKTNRIFETILQEGIEQGQFKPMNIQLVAYDIIMLGHMWALKHWFLKSIMTLDEYIEQQFQVINQMIIE